jgi:hypothetical protein
MRNTNELITNANSTYNQNNANSTYNLTTPSPPPPPPTTTTTTNRLNNTFINIDSDSSATNSVINLMNDIDGGDDTKTEAIELELKAIDMNKRMINKGREQITELTRMNKSERSKEDCKKRRVLKKSVKLLDKERKEGEQVTTVFSITNNGKHLIGDNKLTSPECLELVMDYYSDDDE